MVKLLLIAPEQKTAENEMQLYITISELSRFPFSW